MKKFIAFLISSVVVLSASVAVAATTIQTVVMNKRSSVIVLTITNTTAVNVIGNLTAGYPVYCYGVQQNSSLNSEKNEEVAVLVNNYDAKKLTGSMVSLSFNTTNAAKVRFAQLGTHASILETSAEVTKIPLSPIAVLNSSNVTLQMPPINWVQQWRQDSLTSSFSDISAVDRGTGSYVILKKPISGNSSIIAVSGTCSSQFHAAI